MKEVSDITDIDFSILHVISYIWCGFSLELLGILLNTVATRLYPLDFRNVDSKVRAVQSSTRAKWMSSKL